MRFGNRGCRWAQARNARHCQWSQTFNANLRAGFAAGANGVGQQSAAFSTSKLHNFCDYVPYAQRLPEGLAEQLMNGSEGGVLTSDNAETDDEPAVTDSVSSTGVRKVGTNSCRTWSLYSVVET